MTDASVVCPGCAGTLKLPPGAIAGRQIRCPGCKHILTVPEAEPAPADRAEAETQHLDAPADRAEAETFRNDTPEAEDQWHDADANAVVRRSPVKDDEEDDAVRSYGLARKDGEPTPIIGTVGRFELRKFLGQGAFGKVYLAYDPQLDRAVALKVPRHPPTDKLGVKQFMVEATSAARLKHPNIVAIYEAARAGETLYIASEYVEGVPLSIRLVERPPKPRLAARWVRDLAKALQYAHELGVVHRDIKPANIMIGRQDRAQLMDFGLALRRDAETFSLAPGIVGTPAYMAPEQARGDHSEVGPKSDQFALGVVLYELLTGVTPFRGPMPELLAQVRDPDLAPVSPSRLKADVPAPLADVCLKALAKAPRSRYRTAGEFAADLQRWLDDKPILAGKPPKSQAEAGPIRRVVSWVRVRPRRAAVLVAGVLLLVGAVVGAIRVRDHIQEANRKLEEVRRTEMGRDADVFRERGARLGTQGKAVEGVALLARSYELAAELNDPARQRAVEAVFSEGNWQLPAPPGLEGEAARDWRLAGGHTFGVPVLDIGEGQRLPHGGSGRSTGYAAGGARVLTADIKTKDGTDLRDAATNEHVALLPKSSRVTFSPNAKRAFYWDSLSWGVWDFDRNVSIGPTHEADQLTYRASFNHDGSRVLYYGESGRTAVAEVWDPATARRASRDVAEWVGEAWGRNKVDAVLSPDGKMIVYLAGSTLVFWSVGTREVKDRQMVKSLKQGGAIKAAAFFPDGRLAVASEKGTEIWTGSGEWVGPWLPAAGVTQMAFSPDGGHVALLGPDGVRAWDTTTNLPIGPARHLGATRVQFRPDGKQLLTSSDADVRVWPLPTVPTAKRGSAARLWAEATTGLEVLQDGHLKPLNETERRERRTQFTQLVGLAEK